MALIILAVFILIKRKRSFSFGIKENIWICLFFILLLLSAGWSQFPDLTVKRWIRAVGDVAMVLVILTEDREKEAFEHVLRRMAIILLPLSIIFIKYYRAYGVLYNPFGEMMNVGVTTQKNALGVLCAFLLLILMWRLIKQAPKLDYVDSFLALLALYLLYLSQSMTSLIVFVVGASLLVFSILAKLTKRQYVRFGIAGLIIFLLAQFLLVGFFGDSLSSRFFSATGRDMSFTGRVPLWRDLIIAGSKRPILGAGYGGFWFSNLSMFLWQKHPWRPVSGHNGYIDIFMDLGLFGMGIFIFVLASTLRKNLNALDTDPYSGKFLFALLLMILMHNFTESSFAKAVTFLWILFLFLTLKVSKKDPDKKGPAYGAPV